MGDSQIMQRFESKYFDNISYDDVWCEFKEYGLQCIYPSNDEQIQTIQKLIHAKSSITEFLENKCYDKWVNYQTMHLMLDYLLPKYYDNEDIFDFIKLMVDDEDVADIDNNDKLLLFSVIVSVFNDHGLLEAELLSFVKEVIWRDIISFDVMEKWRLDEFNNTSTKKDALLILSDLIHELQCKEIKENMDRDELNISYITTEDDDEYAQSLDAAYISMHDLFITNINRTVSNRPWRDTVC